MADKMKFTKTMKEFIDSYSFKDEEQIYTNGAELIPVFRVEQALEHYEKEIRNKAINVFIDKAYEELGASENDIYAKEIIIEIAEKLKGE